MPGHVRGLVASLTGSGSDPLRGTRSWYRASVRAGLAYRYELSTAAVLHAIESLIQAILSGAFAAAVGVDRPESSSSAQLPKSRPRSPSSPQSVAVAKVIATGREQNSICLSATSC